MRLKSIGVLRGYAMDKTQLSKIADNIEHEVEEALESERSENAKLRELVSELWVSCPVHDSDCDGCGHKGGRTGCELYDRMRELGVDE